MSACARCGRRIKDSEKAVYSPHRKARYCEPAQWAKCDKLFKARQEHEELKRGA